MPFRPNSILTLIFIDKMVYLIVSIFLLTLIIHSLIVIQNPVFLSFFVISVTCLYGLHRKKSWLPGLILIIKAPYAIGRLVALMTEGPVDQVSQEFGGYTWGTWFLLVWGILESLFFSIKRVRLHFDT